MRTNMYLLDLNKHLNLVHVAQLTQVLAYLYTYLSTKVLTNVFTYILIYVLAYLFIQVPTCLLVVANFFL